MKLQSIVVAGCSILLSQNALATNFYSDIAIGQSNFSSVEKFEVVKEDSDISFSLNAGYAFSDYLSLELAYSKQGDYLQELRIDHPTFVNGPNPTINTDLNSFSFALVPSYPVTDQFSLFAKVGNHWWDAGIETKAVAYEDGVFDHFEFERTSSSGDDLLVGIGVAYAFSEQMVGKFSITEYQFEELDAENYSLSVGYQF